MSPFPHPVTIFFAIVAALAGVVSLYSFFKPSSTEMANKGTKVAQAVIGHDVQNGPGVGQEIINSGGGVGGDITVTVPSGTSAIGTRVIQTGPGVGMRVIQTGPGIGFRSTVIVGPKE